MKREFEQNMSKKLGLQPKTNSEVMVTEGKWGEIPWQFFARVQEPAIELCTAAFCIVTYKGKLVLVEHSSRGHEFTGGHVDPNETIANTVAREVREESRAVISEPQFFGYKKVSPPQPIAHRDNPNLFYPFPHSYVPYYFAEASEILEHEDFTSDIKSVSLANYAEALTLLQPGHNHDKILSYLVNNRLIVVK
jgi:ADP-ribose pyrophosphatase YjhB (NUDIX family)